MINNFQPESCIIDVIWIPVSAAVYPPMTLQTAIPIFRTILHPPPISIENISECDWKLFR